MSDPTNNSPDIAKNSGRGPDGKWLPGFGGRKTGSRNRISREALEKVKGMSGLAFEKLEENLEKGDMRAIEFILNRVLPQGRTLEVDATPDGIRQHLSSGDFSESEARAVATVIERLEKLEKMADLEAKVSELQKLLKDESYEP